MPTDESNWLRLAQSTNKEDRQIAYQIAIGEPAGYQFELSILYLLTNSPSYKFEIYSALNENYRKQLDQLYLPVIGQYPQDNIAKLLPLVDDLITLRVIMELVQERKAPLEYKILFCKKYRQFKGCRLYEAKQAADAFWQKAGK